MARTARNRTETSPVEQRRFHVGIYARLSVEGDERKNESIDTQIEIAKQFINGHPEMILYDVYTDLGATGTHFEREGFQRMLQDIRSRNIDCVIVKDLSRFGRNCVETGNYIQKIFPFMNVRFIAVTDGIDTFDPAFRKDELTVNLKNLVNELYAKDIAQKVRASKQAHWVNGSYTGGVAPYGYKYKWEGEKKILVADPVTAGIVKDIYKMFLDGMNMKQITRELYERKIHTPSSMHSSGHVYQQDGEPLKEWAIGAVKMVLTNPHYIGCMIQPATCGKKDQFRDRQDVDFGDVDIHMNTHEAIISEEDFYKVAKKFETSEVHGNKKRFQKIVPIDEDIYRDVLFCGDCGKKMERISNIKTSGSGERIRWYGYCCTNSGKTDKKCPDKGIAKKKLDELVLNALEQQFKLSDVRSKTVTMQCKKAMGQQIAGLEKERAKIEAALVRTNMKESELYMRYRMENLSLCEYQKQKEQLEHAGSSYEKQLAAYDLEICSLTGKMEDQCKFLRDLLKCKKKNIHLTRAVIAELIKRIEVYADHKVLIQFTFRINELLEKEMEICEETRNL